MKRRILKIARKSDWQWLDRMAHRFLVPEQCMQLVFNKEYFKYKDTIIGGKNKVGEPIKFRYLGKRWYVMNINNK